MSLIESLLPEYDHEMGTTRKLLERVPEERFAWAPHERSMTLGRLATHLAEIPAWVEIAVSHAEFTMDAGSYTPRCLTSRAELLARFDTGVKAGRTIMAGRTDAEMLATWTLKRGEEPLFSLPKIGVIRAWVMNHSIHHRGQLSVYLRLVGVPLPSIYGPSADEA
ncbi:MAG: DinB family protein [Vicinamibacterales bacterium]